MPECLFSLTAGIRTFDSEIGKKQHAEKAQDKFCLNFDILTFQFYLKKINLI